MNKKKLKLVIVLLSSILFISCAGISAARQENNKNGPTIPVEKSPVQVNPEIIASPTTENTALSPDTGCSNLFYPLAENRSWIYEYNYEGETSQIGLSVGAVHDQTAVINTLSMDSGVTTQSDVHCENGAILNFPMITLDLIFGDYIDGGLQTERSSGLFMPSEITFIDNDWQTSWDGEYIIKGNIVIDDEGDNLKIMLSDSPLKMHWTVPKEGQSVYDSITVKAGTFPEAVRINRKLIMDASVTMQDEGNTMAVDGTIELDQTLWYAPRIGLLKQQIDQANITVYGIRYPIILNGTLELVEYR